jgi:hypothetical protein
MLLATQMSVRYELGWPLAVFICPENLHCVSPKAHHNNSLRLNCYKLRSNSNFFNFNCYGMKRSCLPPS